MGDDKFELITIHLIHDSGKKDRHLVVVHNKTNDNVGVVQSVGKTGDPASRRIFKISCLPSFGDVGTFVMSFLDEKTEKGYRTNGSQHHLASTHDEFMEFFEKTSLMWFDLLTHMDPHGELYAHCNFGELNLREAPSTPSSTFKEEPANQVDAISSVKPKPANYGTW